MKMDKVVEIWKKVKAETVGCVEDSFGNCICDYNYSCNKCEADWVQAIFRKELEKAMSKKKFIVEVKDSTVYEIEAKCEEEAVDIAAELWTERCPLITVKKRSS